MIMYLIMLCLIVMVYCSIERWVALRKARIDIAPFMMKIRNTFQSGGVDAVLTHCRQGGAAIPNIIRCGVLKYHLGIERVRDAMEDAAKVEVYRLEKRLPILESAAWVVPMLGLLGALTGMTSTFMRIESLAPTANQADVAESILVGLIGAGFGLAVGIPAYIFSRYLKLQVAQLVHEMDMARTEFLDLMDRQVNVTEKPLPVQVEASPASYVRKPATTLVFDDDLYFRKKR